MANTTKYTRISTRVEVSEDAQYQSEVIDRVLDAFETDDWDSVEIRRVSAVTSSGTAVDLGMYTSVGKIIVKNLDASNYVTGTFRNGDTGAQDILLRALADGGTFDTGGNITVASDLTLIANGAACECLVFIFGAA